MPFTLAIEASNPSCPGAGIAIGPSLSSLGTRDSGLSTSHSLPTPHSPLPSSEPLLPTDRHDDLIAAIDRLCKRLNITPRDLSRIAISTGPGGYTALRIAVAVTKMLCETLKAECIAIPTAAAIARRAVGAPTPFAVILASKDQTAHATIYTSPSQQLREGGGGRLIDAAAIASLTVRALIADQFLPKAMAEAAAAANIPILPPTFDPTAILELSYEAKPIDPLALTPLYPREPEAVTKWRNRVPK